MRELVEESVLRLTERRRRSGTLSFDGVLTDLCEALTGPRSGAAVESLRSRFKVALIDEFQDTDPVQWGIFRRLFGERGAGTTLVLVGDPKQAIYGFRGGDVRRTSTPSMTKRSSTTPARCCQLAVRRVRPHALDTLFGGATFGDPTIPFVPVKRARKSTGPASAGQDGGAAAGPVAPTGDRYRHRPDQNKRVLRSPSTPAAGPSSRSGGPDGPRSLATP